MAQRYLMGSGRRFLDRRTFLRGLSLAAGAYLIDFPAVRLAAAQGPLKLGTLIPLTGPLAEFGPNFRKAADLAAGHLNEAGLRLQLIHADDETAAIPAVAAAPHPPAPPLNRASRARPRRQCGRPVDFP